MIRNLAIIIGAGVLFASNIVAGEPDSVLWRAYARGSQKKQNLLQESQKRVKKLRGKADGLQQNDAVSRDENVRWLLRHRIPASLVVERQLREVPEGAYLAVLLDVGCRLGSARILSLLPDLLQKVRRDESRLAVLRKMGDVQSERYFEVLRQYLQNATSETAPDLIVEASLALSKAEKKGDVETVKKASKLVKDPRDRVRMLMARHRCGDQKMGVKIAKMILSQKSSPNLRHMLIDYVAEEPYREGIMAIAKVAKQSSSEEGRLYALSALRHIREVIGPVGVPERSVIQLEEKDEKDKSEFVNMDEIEKEEPRERMSVEDMSPKQREQLIRAVLSAWKNHATKKATSEGDKPTDAQPLME